MIVVGMGGGMHHQGLRMGKISLCQKKLVRNTPAYFRRRRRRKSFMALTPGRGSGCPQISWSSAGLRCSPSPGSRRPPTCRSPSGCPGRRACSSGRRSRPWPSRGASCTCRRRSRCKLNLWEMQGNLTEGKDSVPLTSWGQYYKSTAVTYGRCRETLLSGKTQYQWPPGANVIKYCGKLPR